MGAADAVPKPVERPRSKEVLEHMRELDGDILVADDNGDMRLRLRTVLKADWASDSCKSSPVRSGTSRPRLSGRAHL